MLVCIYDGAYEHGFADDPVLDGTWLAREGLVIVTANYRSGFEGVPTNRGLLDQVAALRWVQDDVSAVGGIGGSPGHDSVRAGAAFTYWMCAVLCAADAVQAVPHSLAVVTTPSASCTFVQPRTFADRPREDC